MSSADLHDPFFFSVSSPAFLGDHIADLAAGRCAAIRVPALVPLPVCQKILSALTTVSFNSYGTERVYPPVMRFGVGVSDHRKNGQVAASYWSAVDEDRAAWRDLGLGFDPFQMCRDAIGADWPRPVSVGRRENREMSPGVAREPNEGFIVHFDDSRREFSGNLLDATLVTQFAFNLYISVPETGGETVIWRHRWHPADEAFRAAGSYGYADAVVGDAESMELKPHIGDALLFNPGNFHAVRPSRDSRRIALGFSVGLSVTGELLTWG